MKLILENWNKFVNEAEEEESSSVDYKEMLDLIKGEEGSEIKIFIDVPKGAKKGFGATEKRPVPFDYGEFPDYINDADGMGWDLIIAPSESGKEWNKVGNLLPVGRVDYKEGTGKEGNDKIVMASGGEISEEDKEDIKVFFGGISDRFEAPRWNNSLNEDMAEKPTFDHYADQVEIDGGIATLYHVSNADFQELDPEVAFASKSVYSKAEFRSWNRSRVFFFTKLAQEDASMGRIQGDGYIAKVPWKELYPIYKDPLKLSYPDMNDKYMALTGDTETSPGMLNVFERVATLAEELYGYKGFIYPQGGDLENIIVAMWTRVPVTKMETGFYDEK